MPITGVTGVIFFTTFGNLAFIVMPTKIGARTTCKVDTTIPAASTGTTVPRKVLHNKGVMKMAPIVVAVVMSTERATLPFAMKVQRFDAWPPLMEPTRTMPATKAGSRANILPRVRPSAGIMPVRWYRQPRVPDTRFSRQDWNLIGETVIGQMCASGGVRTHASGEIGA